MQRPAICQVGLGIQPTPSAIACFHRGRVGIGSYKARYELQGSKCDERFGVTAVRDGA